VATIITHRCQNILCDINRDVNHFFIYNFIQPNRES
jgi:hypothetical protein